MSDGFSITDKGVNEFGQRLKAFSEKVQRKVIRDAANEVATMFKEEAIRNIETTCKNNKEHRLKVHGVYVTIQPGNLAKNIRIRTLRKMVNGQIDMEVYLKKEFAWYGIFVERGRSNMAANPYMARAYEAKRSEAYDIFKEKLLKEISEGGL